MFKDFLNEFILNINVLNKIIYIQEDKEDHIIPLDSL